MQANRIDYLDFLKSKVRLAQSFGVADESELEVSPVLKPHQAAMVRWMVKGGRRACFAAFGLGKSVIQLETLRLTLEQSGGRGLIVAPLGVRQEFRRDAEMLGIDLKFVRRIEECGETGIYITNYETVRDGKMDPRLFAAASLDEAAVLRGFGGSKTFREFMRLFAGDEGPSVIKQVQRRTGECVPFRFVATATPSPNDYIELLAYADFLGIMDTSQAKTRFFKRDSTNADNLTLHKHKEEEFWLWVASWALFVQKPSDIGYSDEGYTLPDLTVIENTVSSDHSKAGFTKWGQGLLLNDAAMGVQQAAREKRESLPARIEKMREIIAASPDDSFIIWHDLESEREAIEKAVPGVVSVYGSQDLEEREQAIIDFSNGKIKYLAAKPVMLGSGCNFQKHCHRAIYLGIGFKFADFIQSVHRIQRFLQTKPVQIDLIYTECEHEIRKTLERKWQQHKVMVGNMTEIIKKFGLSEAAMSQTLIRKLGIERAEITGEKYRWVNNDNVLELSTWADSSVGLMVSSWPFATQYEYSPNYADFGHSDDNEQFFKQMDYLTPECFRVLQPGRIYAVHVKDRVVPMGMSGLGSPTVYPFHCKAIEHMMKHGFAYMGMKTIVTDVVRENNQTYRLGWTEQCKDGSKMGVGMPEYLLIFRKPPTDRTNSYADTPVVKSKDNYSKGRWQIDAHAFTRSAGDRLMTPEELKALDCDVIFRLFKQYALHNVYDFEHHVKLGEALDEVGRLPSTFMLLQPPSWADDVWTDITRMLTLNGAQHAKGREMHLCPFQFDTVDRCIEQWSNPGEVVCDPFGGLATVPYRAVLLGRIGWGVELSAPYFLDGAQYLRAAEMKMAMPSLFDLEEELKGTLSAVA